MAKRKKQQAPPAGLGTNTEPQAPTKSPPTYEFRQIPLVAVNEWSTVDQVIAALVSHEYGQFRPSSLLVDSFGRDDRITAVSQTRIQSLNGLPLEFEPADDSQEAAQVAKEVEGLWPKMFPEAFLNEWRFSGIFMGVGIAEWIWSDYGADMWVPTGKAWSTQYAYWRWDSWSYWLSTQDAGTIQVLAGDGGNRKWGLYTPFGAVRGWMRGAVRSLGLRFLARTWNFRDWARFNEVHAIPIRQGIAPAGALEPEKTRFLQELAAIGTEPVVLTEQAPGADGPKWDVKLVEPMSTNWENFEKWGTAINNDIAVLLLGQNLTTEVGGSSNAGSKAAGNVHDRVRHDILRSDGSTTAAALKEQVLEPFCLFNYGAREFAPTPRYKTDPPDDKKARADTLAALSTALANLQSVGMPVDLERVAKDFDIPTEQNQADSTTLPAELPDGPSTAPPPQGTGTPELQSARRYVRRRTARKHAEGQRYADRLVAEGAATARRVMRDDLGLISECVRKAKSYAQLRDLLKQAFASMDPSRLAYVTRKALLLANLNGRHDVLEDL